MERIYLILLPALAGFLYMQWRNLVARYPKKSDANFRMIIWVAVLAVSAVIAWARIGDNGPYIVISIYAVATFGETLFYLRKIHIFHVTNMCQIDEYTLPKFGRFLFVMPARPEYSFYLVSNNADLATLLVKNLGARITDGIVTGGFTRQLHLKDADAKDYGLAALRKSLQTHNMSFVEMNTPPWLIYIEAND